MKRWYLALWEKKKLNSFFREKVYFIVIIFFIYILNLFTFGLYDFRLLLNILFDVFYLIFSLEP